MQTFLPYPSFVESAKCLDNKRLGKQRVEAYQILKTLLQGPDKCINCGAPPVCVHNPQCKTIVKSYKRTPWYNHPAVKMWKGYERALKAYLNAMIVEWVRRGFKNTMKLQEDELPFQPIWFGDDRLHASHRSNLLRKDPKHYGQFGWKEPNNLPYFWPTKEGY